MPNPMPGETRTRPVHLRFSPTERRHLERAAERARRPLAVLIREAALDVARALVPAEEPDPAEVEE